MLEPLHIKNNHVRNLPPLHTKDSEMRVRKMKAKALNEMRQKFTDTSMPGSDSEDSTTSTIRSLRETHEGDVEVLKVKLQIERRRQKEILKKKLEDDNKKVVANSANDFSQQNQLSMINTHVNSEVAALKDRLVKEKDRQIRKNLIMKINFFYM